MSEIQMYDDAKNKCEGVINRLNFVVDKLEKQFEKFKPQKTLYGKSGLIGKYRSDYIVQNDLLELSNKLSNIYDRLNNLTLYKVGK